MILAILALLLLLLAAQDALVSLRGGDGILARIARRERVLRWPSKERVRIRLELPPYEVTPKTTPNRPEVDR